jgi:hypothetical protein
MPKKKSPQNPSNKISSSFVTVLAIISILGFVGIISYTLFGRNIEGYIEASWLMIMGFGFIAESSPIRLYQSIQNKMTNRDFSSLTTLIVGVIAAFAGLLTLPGIGIESQAFQAIKGVIAIIAIIFIIIQTWIIK